MLRNSAFRHDVRDSTRRQRFGHSASDKSPEFKRFPRVTRGSALPVANSGGITQVKSMQVRLRVRANEQFSTHGSA